MLHLQEIPYRPLSDTVFPKEGAYPIWLDGDGSEPCGRYSYLCLWPFRRIRVCGTRVFLDGVLSSHTDPLLCLREELARWRIDEPGVSPVPFMGGVCGFLGYEMAGPPDHRPSRHPAVLPDMALGFYDVVLAQDHHLRKSWILSSGFPETDPESRRRRAVARAGELAAWLDQPAQTTPPPPLVVWRAEQDRAAYERGVQRVLDYIRAGDIFQANLSLRFLAARPPGFDTAAYFKTRRAANPAPFAAFLACGPTLALAGFSPERFVRLDSEGWIETRPIKGTRPRGATPEEDAALRRALANSPKDRAENLMIADLMRNDLGRVACPGSVRVPQLHQVERFATVHHLVSVIQARLRPGLDAVDLLRAVFPGGSVTGAPKIRAMQIIDAMEPARRGPYCGCFLWIGFDGAMDSSITIRTLIATPDQLIVQAGGAIVADSRPADEYEEVLLKAAPLLRAAP